jgi:hypothetical protein
MNELKQAMLNWGGKEGGKEEGKEGKEGKGEEEGDTETVVKATMADKEIEEVRGGGEI